MIIWAIIAAISLYVFFLSGVLRGILGERKRESLAVLAEFAKLRDEEERLNAALAAANEQLSSIIALYEITGEVCKYLEKDKIITVFREQAAAYLGRDIDSISVSETLKPPAAQDAEPAETNVPLEIDGAVLGYLSVESLPAQQLEQFYILSQQLILGVRRAELFNRVQTLAVTDTLTGTFSRRYWGERFREEILRSRNFRYKFSFLMIDVDNFKQYNDHYGHLVGDVILKEVSSIIRENIRQIDLLGRYGGEEFALILTETDKEGALFAGERIRQSVEARLIKAYDEELHITISTGISTFPKDASDMDGLIEKADKALYQAKNSGRNRVCSV